MIHDNEMQTKTKSNKPLNPYVLTFTERELRAKIMIQVTKIKSNKQLYSYVKRKLRTKILFKKLKLNQTNTYTHV